MRIKVLAGYSVFLLSIVLLGIGSVSFAADCKGLEKGKCEKSDSCTWVNSYKTKSGKTVSAYCRNKGGKSSSSTSKSKS